MAHTVTVHRPADIIRIRRATDANLRLSVTRRSLPDAQASLTARQQSSKRTQRLGHAPRKRIVDRREVALIMRRDVFKVSHLFLELGARAPRRDSFGQEIQRGKPPLDRARVARLQLAREKLCETARGRFPVLACVCLVGRSPGEIGRREILQ